MDKERAIKAAHAAGLLRADLLELVRADDPVLSEYALLILEQFTNTERALARLAEVHDA